MLKDRGLPSLITEWIKHTAKAEVEAQCLRGTYQGLPKKEADDIMADDYNRWVNGLRADIINRASVINVDIRGMKLSNHEYRRLRVLAERDIINDNSFELPEMLRADIDIFYSEFLRAMTRHLRTYKEKYEVA